MTPSTAGRCLAPLKPLLLLISIAAAGADLSQELLEAVRSGQTANVRSLLGRGANPNAKDDNGSTALMEAATRGHTPIVKLLLAKRAEVNAKSEGFTVLMLTVTSFGPNRVEVVKALLDGGADINAKYFLDPSDLRDEGQTALDLAETLALAGNKDADRIIHLLKVKTTSKK